MLHLKGLSPKPRLTMTPFCLGSASAAYPASDSSAEKVASSSSPVAGSFLAF